MIPLVIGELASTVAGLLTPYLVEKGTNILKSVGDDAFTKTEQFLETLRKKWFTDEESAAVLKKYEETPERQTVFEAVLKEKMENNPEFKEYIEKYLTDVGPQLIGKFKVGDDEKIYPCNH